MLSSNTCGLSNPWRRTSADIPDKAWIFLPSNHFHIAFPYLCQSGKFRHTCGRGVFVSSGVARRGARGAPAGAAPPQTLGRLRRKNVAVGSVPRTPAKRGLGRSPNRGAPLAPLLATPLISNPKAIAVKCFIFSDPCQPNILKFGSKLTEIWAKENEKC